MYDAPKEFFVEAVLADYEAYDRVRRNRVAGASNDLRLATHSTASLFHLADHVFNTYKGQPEIFNCWSLRDYHTYLIGKCPDFELVRDCANAHKHKSLTRGNPSLISADSMAEIIVLTEYQDEKGPYRIATKEIHVKVNHRPVRCMHEILLNVRGMWFDELNRIGIWEKKKIKASRHRIPKRQSDDGSARLDFRIIRGLSFKQTIILKKYTPEKRVAEVVDLSRHR